ncbi:hypothetical protein FQR65_LT10554 [Abscondita terminalis]|nr:hypothetical protein FQR65_LT10554 [Abscondita terminalis]
MAGMFDQFEQPAQKFKNNNTWNQSGFIHMKLEQDVPIFGKARMNFTPSDKVTHVAISNKYLVVAMANDMLFRMSIHHPDLQDEISLSKFTKTCRLSNLFLDPTGVHLLLSFAPKVPRTMAELVYLSQKSNKLRQITKFQGHEFTEIGWNHNNDSEVTTGPILLGTSKGLIFETEILLEGDKFFTTGLEIYWKQVFDIGKGTNTPITGIEFYQIPNSDKYFVFIATPSRLYYFNGHTNFEEKPLLQQVFSKYLNVPESQTFYEVKSSLRYSRLRFWKENREYPTTFAWLIENSVIYSKFDPITQNDVSAIMKNCKEISQPKPLYQDYSVSQKPPIACVLTEFHVLLAYSDTIKGISLLNKELIYEDNYNEAFGRLVNLVTDNATGTIWAVAENAVFRFKITKEERNVWQIYCESKNFELAKKYSINNPVHYNYVLIKEADMLFEEGKYLESAKGYAMAQSGFEEVCLKFIQVNQHDALKTFLCDKLQTFTAQDKTQITLIVIWVVELYLNELEEMRIAGKEQTNKYFEVQKDFQTFLALPNVSERIKSVKSTIYDLMASHGDKMNSIQLTIVHKDFEKLIRQHIYKNSFHEALDVLKSQTNKELFYQFAPILMQEIPRFTVKALIEQGSNLLPVKLLPALANCNGELHSQEIITYLEFCTEKLLTREPAIHNLLVNYNVHFALRLCQEMNLTKACVQLSALLGLWESAVDLALTLSVDLAKQYANIPAQGDLDLRKKLWLKIAKSVVSEKNNIEQAMQFLEQCDLLRIEDILPFFSDFVTIDHFRSAICKSLKEYNKHIQDLQDEMEEATQSADLVRKEIQTFRNRYTFINCADVCEICELTLIIRPFYIFPCNHNFHRDCLLNELIPMLGPAKKFKLAELERQQKILSSQVNVDTISTNSAGISARESVKADIDNIIASECLYCGENMIRNIDLPFINEKEYDQVSSERVTVGLYDEADKICGLRFGVDEERLYQLLDENILLVNPDDEFVQKYTNCWMLEHGFINRVGIINLEKFEKWYVTFGYYYVKKDDNTLYSMETRSRTFDFAVTECKDKLKIILNVRNQESYFYNCMVLISFYHHKPKKMSDTVVTITLAEMVDLALCSPEVGAVNFNVLHSLLHVIIQQNDMNSTKIQFKGTDGERIQTLMEQYPTDTTITLTEYVVMADNPDMPVKVKTTRSSRKGNKEVEAQVKEKTAEIGEKVDEEETEGEIELEEDGVIDTIVLVEKSTKISSNNKCAALEDADLEQLREEVKALKDLPANTDLIEALRPHNEAPVLEMYQVLSLTKRMDANEVGLKKLASMIEDLAKEQMECCSNLSHRLQATEDTVSPTKCGTINMRLLELEQKLQEYFDHLGKLEEALRNQIKQLQDYITDLEKEIGEIIELMNAGQSDEYPSTAELYNMIMEIQEELSKLSQMVEILWEERGAKHGRYDVMQEEIEMLKIVKADRETLEDILASKADVCLVNRKVSLEQFDAACDSLANAISDLLTKMKQQEMIWNKALCDIQNELENKVDKAEFIPLRDYVIAKLKTIQERLKDLANLKQEAEAAGTKSKLLKGVKCLSCDHEVAMRKEFDTDMFPPPPSRQRSKGTAAQLAFDLNELRNQRKISGKNVTYSTEPIIKSDEFDNIDQTINRYCGGLHTTTTAQQRIARVGNFAEDYASQFRATLEKLLVGTDGIVYKAKEPLKASEVKELEKIKSTQSVTIKSDILSERTGTKMEGEASTKITITRVCGPN